jgi:hypothetical protein
MEYMEHVCNSCRHIPCDCGAQAREVQQLLAAFPVPPALGVPRPQKKRKSMDWSEKDRIFLSDVARGKWEED